MVSEQHGEHPLASGAGPIHTHTQAPRQSPLVLSSLFPITARESPLTVAQSALSVSALWHMPLPKTWAAVSEQPILAIKIHKLGFVQITAQRKGQQFSPPKLGSGPALRIAAGCLPTVRDAFPAAATALHQGRGYHLGGRSRYGHFAFCPRCRER